MELHLLFLLIENLDGLTQKSIGQVIGDFERFLDDPAGYLARETIVVGPRKRYLLRLTLGLLLAFGGVLIITIAVYFLCAIAGAAIPQGLADVGGLLLLLLYVGLFIAVFRYFRGGRCILSAAGVKLQFRSHTVVCPWSLFNTYGQPHVLPEKEVFLLPVAPAAVRQVVQFKAGHEEPLACGLEVRAPHWKFQSLRQVVLKPIYEVNPEEFAKFLLGLGQLLGREQTAEPVPVVETVEFVPATETSDSHIHDDLPLAVPSDKGWIVFHLTRLTFPPYCCSCLTYTGSTHSFQSETGWDSDGTVKISVPVCYVCRSDTRRRKRRATLLGMGGGLLLGALISACIGIANPQVDIAAITVMILLIASFIGGPVGRRFFHKDLARFRYHASEGTVSARFWNRRYAELLLSGQLQGAEA